jgi:phthalate 4,5-dioxygenase reductase subunit
MTPDPELRELTLQELTLDVRHKSEIADGVFLFELRAPDGGELPPFTPGSHITVTAPSGQKRRYSLCNDPSERDRYLIAVKQETSGRGGSLSFTREINEGDRVTAEPPANEFEMATSEPKRLIFIAGGIGITPIRAMILHCLRRGKGNFMLYYFTRTPEMMAFREEFASSEFEGKAVLHHDHGDPDQAYDLWPVLEEQRGAHLYCCGPRGLMDAVRDMTGHWPDSAVHFEDFVGASAPHADDRPFEVRLAKSGASYEVAAHVSILDTLRKNGHVLVSSCESGTCGTCRCRFLEGEVDHRDLVLSDDEKKSEIMICVSRAISPTLTLDV